MRLAAVLATAAVAAGCARLAEIPPANPARDVPPAAVRDCSRQFDDQDAGFQTCVPPRGERGAEE